MKETPVFWLGRKPGMSNSADLTASADALEPAIRAACSAQGIEPQEFVAALGDYGSWLVSFARTGQRQRIVWNGRDRKLILQSAIPTGGWADVRDCELPNADSQGFTSGIATLIS
jgi:hypothetical protein